MRGTRGCQGGGDGPRSLGRTPPTSPKPRRSPVLLSLHVERGYSSRERRDPTGSVVPVLGRCRPAGVLPAPPFPPPALSLDSILRPPAHPCPPGRAARGTCGAAHVQAVICSPGKAPRREGTGGTGITRLPRGRAAAPASPAGDSPPPVSFARSAAGSRWIKYLEVCSGE